MERNMEQASILIVDDRRENLLTLERLLEEDGISVVPALSGEEALALTFDHEFALVLMDVNMPGMDGYETARLLRGNRRTKDIPIIFVTASQKDPAQIFKAYDSGAVDYLMKPLSPVVLKGKVGVFLKLHHQRILLERKTRELDAKLTELEELNQELEISHERLRILSSHDGLTGLNNRRRFDELLRQEWSRGVRMQEPLSIVLIDIDHFKAYNDTYGHVSGDLCLRRVALALENALLRSTDMVARYGGEEFIAILPDTDEQGALQVAERMQEKVRALKEAHDGSPSGTVVTISIGVGATVPDGRGRAETLVDLADKALYHAKRNGRNRICVAPAGACETGESEAVLNS